VNIVSKRALSITARKPLAPVFLSRAIFAISLIAILALSSKSLSIPLFSNISFIPLSS